MPRWPRGLHPMSQSLPATGGRSRRAPVTHQAAYWHRNAVPLVAGTPPVTVNSAGAAATLIGPAGIGEQWDVQLVAVQTSSGVAVPCTATIWLAVAGFTQNLLMQTTSGGLDDLGISSTPPVQTGESIAVIWAGANPGDTAWAIVKGTKYVLEAG